MKKIVITGGNSGIGVERAAANPVHLSTTDGWRSGSYWDKPGKIDQVISPPLDPAETEKVGV